MSAWRIRIGAAVTLMLVLLMTAGCQGYRDGASRTVGEFTDDVAIQARVKLALLNDEDIKGLRINTEVNRGVVTLYGRVASHAQMQKAVDIATAVKGVQTVENRLTVVTE